MTKPLAGVTQVIESFQKGDKEAFERLLPLVYDHLKKIARRQMGGQRPGHTLSPTALVNEAYLHIRDQDKLEFRDRSHFFALAAQCMRWLLKDYAKAKTRQKRGGPGVKVSFDENVHWTENESIDYVALDEALASLSRQDPRLCQVAELRFLAGLSVEETAEVLKTSSATVKRDWQLAKAWLNRRLNESQE